MTSIAMINATSGPIDQPPDERIVLAVARAMCGGVHPCTYHVRLARIAVPAYQAAADEFVIPDEVAAERKRSLAWIMGRVTRSRAAQAIRDGEQETELPPVAPEAVRDPSRCWRCGVPLHPGHFCAVIPHEGTVT